MQNPRPMRLLQRFANLRSVAQRLFQRQRPLLEAAIQRLAFQVLHHQVVSSILVPHVMQSANVRMIERGDRARLAFETLLGFRV